MSKTVSKSDATKAQIMRASIRIFTERGFAGSSLRDIANAAELNMGLIRYHFGNKADLYRDTLAHLAGIYNEACLDALHQAEDGGSVRDIIYAWLAAPYTHWPVDSLASGEEVLCFLNKMGYEPAELTREVYESHYSYAQQEWQASIRSHYPQLAPSDWLWFLTNLRGMYLNIVAHNNFTLWGLPAISNKTGALQSLAADAQQQLESYPA